MIKSFLYKNTINKNLLANSLNQILGIGFPLVIQFYLIRTINLEDIGYLGIFNSSSTLVLLAINFFYIYILKILTENPEKTKSYLINSIALAYALFIIPFSIYITFLLINYPHLYNVILICAIPIITTPLAMDYYYQANLKNDYILYRRLFVKTVFVILLFLLVKDESDFIFYAAISSFTLSLEHFINIYKIRKKVVINNLNKKIIIKILKGSISYLPFNITYNIIPHISIILGIYFLDINTLAIITILFKLVNLATTFVSSSVMILLPHKIKSKNKRFNDFKFFRNTFLFSIFIVIAFLVCSKLIFYFFLDQYTIDNLHLEFFLLSLYVIIHSLYNYLVFNFYLINNKTAFIIKVNIIIITIFVSEIIIFQILNLKLIFSLAVIIPPFTGLMVLIFDLLHTNKLKKQSLCAV